MNLKIRKVLIGIASLGVIIPSIWLFDELWAAGNLTNLAYVGAAVTGFSWLVLVNFLGEYIGYVKGYEKAKNVQN